MQAESLDDGNRRDESRHREDRLAAYPMTVAILRRTLHHCWWRAPAWRSDV